MAQLATAKESDSEIHRLMPCNTAHYWIEEIRNAVGIQIVDMI